VTADALSWLEAFPHWQSGRLWRDLEQAPAHAVDAMITIEREFAALGQEPGAEPGLEAPAGGMRAALGLPPL
jgi:hypothetical protein